MVTLLTFSVIAMLLVFLAGRKDVARDPRLTLLLLVVLGLFPLLSVFLPKLPVLPASETASSSMIVPVLTAVWALGFAFSLGRLALSAYGLTGWRRRSTPLGETEGIELRSLQGLCSPVATGVWKPIIYVPENWNHLPSEQRSIILAHEFAHHRRHDPLLRWVVELVRAVHWYHPGVHWMVRRFALQSEFACDEQVLRQGYAPRSYAGVLCDFAQKHNSPPFAPAMAETSSLEKRVKRIAAPPGHRTKLPLLGLALLGLFTATALCMIDKKIASVPSAAATEIQLRFTANPFPGEP
jgi:hypothetical protein